MKKGLSVLSVLILTCLLMAFVVLPTVAQAAGQRPISEKWTFEVVPYLWFMSLNGTMGVKGQTADIDASFGDIWEVTDFAGAIAGTARKDRWLISGNLLYAKLGDSQDLPVPATLDWTFKETIFEFFGGYRPAFLGPVELLAGGRYWNFDMDLDFKPGPSVGGSKNWVDPLVGFLIPYDLTDKWTADLRATIGGFGVASDLTWEIGAAVGYNFKDWLNVALACNHLDVDYENDGFLADFALSGAAVAVKFKF